MAIQVTLIKAYFIVIYEGLIKGTPLPLKLENFLNIKNLYRLRKTSPNSGKIPMREKLAIGTFLKKSVSLKNPTPPTNFVGHPLKFFRNTHN